MRTDDVARGELERRQHRPVVVAGSVQELGEDRRLYRRAAACRRNPLDPSAIRFACLFIVASPSVKDAGSGKRSYLQVVIA